ncbi:MAG TPA: hypothetical protein VF269_00495 [Rhodanobacteraceae bacterium]
MNADLIARLHSQCDGPRDGALLRFSLAQALLEEGLAADAVAECRRALVFNADYSAAWKLLGKALLASDDPAAAADAWRHGMDVATSRGDIQAAKEMRVFLRRLDT